MNRATRYLKKLSLGATIALLMVSTSMSDDIDVYVGAGAASAVDTFVVFTLDVRPNVMASEVCTNNECDELFNEVGMGDSLYGSISFFELLVASLKKVLGGINNDTVHVALMIPHNNDSNCAGQQTGSKQCSNGAYVLSGFKSTGSTSEMDQFFRKLEAIPLKGDEGISGNWSHSYQLKELFFEMYRYITKGDVYNGLNGWTDFKTDKSLNIDDPDDTPFGDDAEPVAELEWDTDAVHPSEKRYLNKLDPTSDHCSSLFSVNFAMGTANKDGDSDDAIEQARPDGLGISLDNSNFGSRVQVLEYLANNDLFGDLVGTQNIISYFVAKESGGSGDVGGRANDWAQAGGTGSALIATDDPDELVDLLSGLFNEILSVSTTFVAASVPANVFNRAETLNEVFLAIFEPDESRTPFWAGNVKKLTTTTIEETISCEDTTGDGIEDTCETEKRKILVDVLEADKENPTSAINPNDGRVRPGALTYWTRTGTDDAYLPAPITDEEEQEFQEGTDGRKVARGAAGQAKPGFLNNSPGETNNSASDTTLSGPRKIFTEADDDDNVTSGMVNLNADADLSTAINLLTDARLYPGGGGLTYGANLYRTVMSDCPDCAASYVDENNSTHKDTAESRVNNLILYARGHEFTDIDIRASDDSQTDEDESTRFWWQSDPLHSRPLALNHGTRGSYTETDPDIRIVFAGNDGHVQMIRDGRKPTDGSEDGVEAWSFLPREFVPLQKRLLEGNTGAYAPGEPIAEGQDPRIPLHPYSMDGAPTALIIDNNRDGTIETSDGDQAYIFLGQRRGGKRYYALDVSDPDEPKFLWSIGKDDTGGAFAEMGQSWSLMRAGIMQVDESGAIKNRPVLIFSGGYNGDDGGDGAGDLGKDSRVKNHDNGTEVLGTDDHEGNALFIVNALTGDLIWKAVGPSSGSDTIGTNYYSNLTLEHAGLVDSVPASPTVVDGNGDGFIDRAYFPDTGGNVWRMDAANPDRSTWRVNKLFAGGRHVTGQGDNDHDIRFFNAPDVVLASDDSGDFDAVIVASGDRAHPLGTEVENWLYMIKDRNTTSGDPPASTLTNADLADLTDNCLQDDSISCSSSVTDNLVNGWKLQLKQCEAGGTNNKCGEKSLATPLTIEGTVFLTTYLPVLADSNPNDSNPETCGTKEGGGLFYALDLQTAGGVLNFNPNNDTSTEETPERFERLASPGIPPEVVAISPDEVLRPDLTIEKTSGRASSNTFWYERQFR